MLAPLMVLLAAPITAQNWMNHPAIAQVRRLVQGVDAGARRGQFSVRSVPAGPNDDISSKLLCARWTDARGVIRRFQQANGSAEYELQQVQTYDPAGLLRFAFTEFRAVNGARAELRQYFDARGQALWTDRRATGRAYAFPTGTDGLKFTQRDVQAALAAGPCR